jgi:hypothetical protein
MESIQALVWQKKKRGINVAPWRVRDAFVRGVINKQCSSMSGLPRMRHWMHSAPLKKCTHVLQEEAWINIHWTRKILSALISQNVTHLLPKHKRKLPTTFEEVIDNWLEILQKLWQPDHNIEVWKHEVWKHPNPFLGMRALYGRNSGTTSPLIMGLCCDSRAILVLTLSHFVDLTRIASTPNTNHIFSLRWTIVFGEVRIWWWQNWRSF